jgi:hypothetical protein
LAGGAVLIAPVSAAVSLQTGNFTGTSAKTCGLLDALLIDSSRIHVTLEPIPYAKEQGIVVADQGYLGAEQGCRKSRVGGRVTLQRCR